MARLVAAVSGGVDSAVATARMLEDGHEVTAVHLRLWTGAGHTAQDDAAAVAAFLGVPFEVWDFSSLFTTLVMGYFADEYARGRTPNPCLKCNETIKFTALGDKAAALGFDGVVTGHYATLRARGDGIVELHRAAEPAKDQSYVLGVLSQRLLARSYFPLGGLTKAEVRAEARRLGIPVAGKPDSSDVCFIPGGATAAWLRERLGPRPGMIRDETGRELGGHQGIFAYTIGQRKGLRIGVPAADGRPRYVAGIDPGSGTVTVGPRESLRVSRLDCTEPHWCESAPVGRARFTVQLRAHAEELPAVVEVMGETVRIDLATPAYGIAPGQTAVIYDGTRVIGAATIDATGP